MQTSLWYSHYQGAVYPLDLKAEPNYGVYKKETIKSLVSLCSEYIVSDSTMTLTAVQYIPYELNIALMTAALLDNRDRALEILIAHWPLETLSLRKLAPNLFTSLVPLYNTSYLADVVRQSLRYTTCLAHTYLECLKRRTPTKLRYLDITGYPTAEVILFYLSTHCLLAHNEARQNVMVDMYNRVVTLLPDITEATESSGSGLLSADNSLPNDCFVVKLDAFVTSDQTHVEMCKALKVSGFDNSTFKLRLQTLDATCLGQPKLKIMLQLVNAQYLNGLRLKYNSLNCEDFCELASILENFTNLVALDLSCNCISLYQNDVTCDRLARVLSKLSLLKRLDLSNNRIKTKLRRILSDIQKPLQHLRLVACGLSVSDITYLSMSHHVGALEELDLSENSFKQASLNIGKLFKSCKNNLLTLELEDCALNDDCIHQILAYMSMPECLMYVNVSENTLSTEALNSLVQVLSKIPSVIVLKMSYPNDCYQYEDESEIECAKKTCKENFELVIDKERKSLGITNSLKLIVTELNKIIYDT